MYYVKSYIIVNYIMIFKANINIQGRSYYLFDILKTKVTLKADPIRSC